MTIYSIMPEETVFGGWDDFNPQYMDLTVNGVQMQVEMLNGTQARIVRLLSNNCYDYLNPTYSPGSVIEFAPQFGGNI